MQYEEQMTTPTEPEMSEAQGIDSLISMVDGFAAMPESITPESLNMLKEGLMDLKTILEPAEAPQAAPSGSSGGLAGMIGG